MELFEYLASIDEKRVVHPGLQKNGLKMEQVYPDLYAYEDAIAAFKKGGGTEKVIEWEETLPIELAKGGIIARYAKGSFGIPGMGQKKSAYSDAELKHNILLELVDLKKQGLSDDAVIQSIKSNPQFALALAQSKEASSNGRERLNTASMDRLMRLRSDEALDNQIARSAEYLEQQSFGYKAKKIAKTAPEKIGEVAHGLAYAGVAGMAGLGTLAATNPTVFHAATSGLGQLAKVVLAMFGLHLNKGGVIPGYANGVFSVPGPKGAGDVVPAMLSPGEAVIPAKKAEKHRGLIQQMIYGKIPGYSESNIERDPSALNNVPPKSDDSWSIEETPSSTTESAPSSDRSAKVLGKIEGVLTKFADSKFMDMLANRSFGGDKGRVDADGNIVSEEDALDEEGNLIEKKKKLSILSHEQIQEQIALIDEDYAKLARDQEKLKSIIVKTPEEQKQFEENEAKMLQTEENFKAARGIEEKKPSKGSWLTTRNKFTGKAQGLLYGASGLAGMATQAPGDIGKAAQAALPAIGAMTGAMSMIPGPAGMVVGGLLAVATISSQLQAHFQALRDESAKSVRALGASTESMKKLSEFAKKVGSRELMDKRRAESAGSFFYIRPGKKTFGESYMESEAGKELTQATSKALKSGDIRATAALVTSQMGTAIGQGILSPEQARSIVANLAKQIKNTSFGIDINAKITSMFGPDGAALDITKNTIKLSLEAVATLSGNAGQYADANTAAAGGAAVTEATIAALNSIQAATDALAVNPKATQKDKDELTAYAQETITKLYDNIELQSRSNEENLAVSARTAVDEAYKGTGLEDTAKGVAESIKSSDATIKGAQEVFLTQMLASKVIGVTQMQTALNLGMQGTDLIDLIKTNPTALNQLLDIASTMAPENGKSFMANQQGKTSNDLAETASAIQLTNKTTGVFEMDEATKQAVQLYYSGEGLAKAKEINKEFQALDKKKDFTFDTILKVSGNNKELTDALTGNKKGEFTKYFSKFKDKKNKLIFTTEFNSLVNLGDDELGNAIRLYLSQNNRMSEIAGMGTSEVVQKFKVEYAAYEANRVTDAGALQDLTFTPGEGSGTGNGPESSILDKYVKMLRDGSNYAQKLTIGWTASYNALAKYGTKAISQMAGIGSLMKQYGGDAGIINDFLGGTEEEQNRIIDKTTGKLRAGAGELIAKLKEIKDMQEYGLSYVLATPAERLAKDNEMYQAGLDVIAGKEKKINDKYDKRIKALDEIGKLQERNNQQQQNTMDIAEALSRGDIAAAAKAAQKARQDAQKQALEDTKTNLENARKAELESITVKIFGTTLNRSDLEEKIATNSQKIAESKLKELTRQILIGRNAVIAADASARQLANGQALAALPKGTGGGKDNGGKDDGGKEKEKEVPPAETDYKKVFGTTLKSLKNVSSIAGTGAGYLLNKEYSELLSGQAKTDELRTQNQKKTDALTDIGNADFSGYQNILKNLVMSGDTTQIQAYRGKLTPAQKNTFDTLFEKYNNAKTAIANIDSYTGEQTQNQFKNLPKEIQTAFTQLKDYHALRESFAAPYRAAKKAYDAFVQTNGNPSNWNDADKKIGTPLENQKNEAFTALNNFDKLATGIENRLSLLGYGKNARKLFAGYAMGGMVIPKGYAIGGGIYGTDTVPAMLTPGEFVIKKSAVDSIGSSRLNAMNNGAPIGDSVYNYSINISVKSDVNANQIADTVLRQIEKIDSQRLRSVRI